MRLLLLLNAVLEVGRACVPVCNSKASVVQRRFRYARESRIAIRPSPLDTGAGLTVAAMHVDFAGEYARRSDDEIRLLIKDRHNLVDDARDALDVEVRKRQNNGFQLCIHEPEEPRVHVEEDDEEGNEVIVHSRELIFPKICPRCLSHEAGSIVKISCASASSGGLVLAFDFVSGLSGYLFFRYPVPFCRSCATSVRVRRWTETVFILIAIAGSLYAAIHFHLSALVLLLALIGLFAVGGLLGKLLDLSKRWPSAGIEILSKWSSKERRIEFANPEYEKAFVALNGRRRG